MATITNTIRWASNTEELKRNLKDGLNQIEATRAGAERMVKSLSGDKLTQAAHNFAAAVQQLGGVEKLTNAERERGNALLTKAIEKYSVLGQTAPKALQDMAAATSENVKQATLFGTALGTIGGVFAARAIVNFGRELFADADALKRMSDQTGITVQGLQLLRAAGDEAGNTIEEITGAVLQLENRLGGGDQGAARALKTLGLSLADLQRLSPDQQFREIGTALLAVEDPAKQVALAMDLFGKTGAKVLPTLKANFDEIAKSAITMSAGTVDAFDRMGDAAAQVYRNTKAVGATFLATVFEFFEAPVIRAAHQFENFQKMVASIKRPPVTTGVTTSPGLPGDAELANITRDLNDQLRQKNERTREAQREEEKARKETERWAMEGQRLLESIDRLEIITNGYRISVGELDSTELKSIEVFLAKRKAADDLTIALHKLEQVRVGEVDTGALGGLDVESIGRLRNELDNLKKSTKSWQDDLNDVARAFSKIGQIVPGIFGAIANGIGTAVEGLTQLIQAQIAFGQAAVGSFARALASLNIFLAAFQIAFALFSGLRNLFGSGPGAIGSAAGAAASAARRAGTGHAATGGLVTAFGVQHFAAGGLVAPNSKDTVPIWAMPGEMFINPQQQARLFHFIDGQVPVAVANGNITENHYHSHNWDLRQAVVTNDQGLQRLSREVAKRNATGVARNQDSINTRGRAGYGLRS